jgi:hypothetical protein
MSSQINLLQAILNSSRTVFTIQSLMVMSGLQDSKKITKSLHYYASEGKILNPRRGIYTKLRYEEQEMACLLYRPSYISLEYVLQRAGVVFQWDESITCVSYLSRTIDVEEKAYQYRKINPELWIGMEGIEQRDNIAIACPERAFLDMMYLSAGNCYFDNLCPLSKKRIRELLPLYRSAILNERVKEELVRVNG